MLRTARRIALAWVVAIIVLPVCAEADDGASFREVPTPSFRTEVLAFEDTFLYPTPPRGANAPQGSLIYRQEGIGTQVRRTEGPRRGLMLSGETSVGKFPHEAVAALSAVARCRDPGGSMDVQADVGAVAHDPLARVQSHSHSHGSTAGPLPGGQRALRRHAGRKCRRGAREGCEQRIPFGAECRATSLVHRFAEQAVMLAQEVRVPIAELLEQPRRALNVREQEGHGPDRKGLRGWHHVSARPRGLADGE